MGSIIRQWGYAYGEWLCQPTQKNENISNYAAVLAIVSALVLVSVVLIWDPIKAITQGTPWTGTYAAYNYKQHYFYRESVANRLTLAGGTFLAATSLGAVSTLCVRMVESDP